MGAAHRLRPVNLSPRQFTDENLLNDLDEVLRATAMPPHLLQLEITESMVMQNVERGVRVLDAIQSPCADASATSCRATFSASRYRPTGSAAADAADRIAADPAEAPCGEGTNGEQRVAAHSFFAKPSRAISASSILTCSFTAAA
jgi:hypothetical protein